MKPGARRSMPNGHMAKTRNLIAAVCAIAFIIMNVVSWATFTDVRNSVKNINPHERTAVFHVQGHKFQRSVTLGVTPRQKLILVTLKRVTGALGVMSIIAFGYALIAHGRAKLHVPQKLDP
jgi:hypothetical protein